MPDPLALVIHPADHAQTDVIMLPVRLHVHTIWVCVGQIGPQGLVQLLVDRHKAAEILDADLHPMAAGQMLQILADFLKVQLCLHPPFYVTSIT